MPDRQDIKVRTSAFACHVASRRSRASHESQVGIILEGHWFVSIFYAILVLPSLT